MSQGAKKIPRHLSNHPYVPDARDPSTRRCVKCGYNLAGAPELGICPECGSAHAPDTDYLLAPWPPTWFIIVRATWPLFFAILAIIFYFTYAPTKAPGVNFVTGILVWLFTLIGPINGYLYVKDLLQKHMPENYRATGLAACWRGLGVVACSLIFLTAIVILCLPIIWLGALLFT